jgi:hypothetical protein
METFGRPAAGSEDPRRARAGGRIFHEGVTNPLETLASFLSFGATSVSDVLAGETSLESIDPRDWTIGEDVRTSGATFISGLIVTEPMVDAAIDIYATGYNYGAFCGISTVLDCFGN